MEQFSYKKGLCGTSVRIEHWQLINILLIVYDIFAVNAAYFLALWIRFDCRYSAIPPEFLRAFVIFSPVYSVLCVAIFWFYSLYQSLWRFASYMELVRTLTASLVTCSIHAVLITVLFQRMPFTYYVFGAILQFLAVVGMRFSYRLMLLLRGLRQKNEAESHMSRVMLIGAGTAGQMILRDVQNTDKLKNRICCIIDDNSNKWNRFMDGIPIVGGRQSIIENVEKYKIEKIFLAIPRATVKERQEILDICKETGCELKQLPAMYQLVSGEVSVGTMRDVAVEDLLGREPIKTDLQEVFAFLNDKTILVTGGGGSIGSELCRQIAARHPKQLIIFDIYENNAYAIQLELKKKHPDLNLTVLIGSVRDSRRLQQVFSTYKPEIVYHAAAHKHVPLMEDSPCESIKNNAIGTYKTAYAAMVYGCKKFVLISTDKAVNPTNIMGASKRICEMVVQTLNEKIRNANAHELPRLFTHLMDDWDTDAGLKSLPVDICTEYVAVRFGNVLGSNGSVIPLFKEQISQGGPVTVTHPDIIRYFMTIPEAVSLVLQAGTYAKGGEIFVLDMGSPVKIDTLARNLIKLSGYKPDVDIKIEYTGLRPGEKLYEEKLMAEEGLKKTANSLIHIGLPVPFNADVFLSDLTMLMQAAYHNQADISKLVSRVVTTYKPAQDNRIEMRVPQYRVTRPPAAKTGAASTF